MTVVHGKVTGTSEVPATSAMKWNRYPAYKESGVEWLGEVPAHWDVRQLKYATRVNPDTLPEDVEPECELEYIDIGNVDSVGNVLDTETHRFQDAPSRARRKVVNGDTFISTVRTYLRAIGYAEDPPDNLIVSTGFAVLRPTAELYPRFLWRLVQSEQFVDTVVANSEGVSYPAINPTRLAQIPIWIPPFPEQRTIAGFLDRETERIDTLIAKKERLVELLQEKRTALISHAVTKGLDPDSEIQDSGIPAVGKIPAHWEVERNKRVFKEVDERSTTGEEELLTVSHITGVTPRSEKEVTMFMAESLEGYKICRPDDLVINTMWAWMGALGISEYEGLVSPSYNVYRLRDKEVYVPKYLDFLYRTPAYICEIERHSKGVWTSRLRLYPDAFFNMYTITSPLAEQHQIVDFILQELESINDFNEKLRASIETLREYRTALISAAVTGKIDVREEAAV